MTIEEFNNNRWSIKSRVVYEHKGTVIKFNPIAVDFEKRELTMDKNGKDVIFSFDEVNFITN